MGEIKFRAWDRVVKKLHEWDSVQTWTDWWRRGDLDLIRFTGLKDRNGKEIYEGDMFGKLGGDNDRPNEYEVRGQVKFDTDFSMFIIELTNGGWMQLYEYMNTNGNSREIIGNIYENPELVHGNNS